MANRVVIDESRPAVARATLNDPGNRNHLDEVVIRDLIHAVDRAERQPDRTVFVVDSVVDGHFCSGLYFGDLDRNDWRPRVQAARSLLDRLVSTRLVTIAVVDGAATGGGAALAAACDQVIAGSGAEFRMTEVLLGVIPAVAMPVVCRRVGRHRGFGLALTAERLSGEDAARIGFADRLADEPEAELRRLLVQLRGADGSALPALKRYYTELFPVFPSEDQVLRALADRFDDPGVRERLARFHRQGAIS